MPAPHSESLTSADAAYDDPWTDCWQCSGDGVTYSCFEEFACIDSEGGCDECMSRCDICRGKGGWPTLASSQGAR